MAKALCCCTISSTRRPRPPWTCSTISGRRLQSRVHEAEVLSDDDCLLRRGDLEASEGPRERRPPDFERRAHDQRVARSLVHGPAYCRTAAWRGLSRRGMVAPGG